MKKRIVITGLGAMTALGEGAEALWTAALQKKSGVNFLNEGVGAAIADFEPEKFISQRKSIKVMAKDIQLAVAGASLALEDAGLKSFSMPRGRMGVIVGSGVLNHELDELAYSIKNSLDSQGKLDLKKFGGEGISSLFPLWLLKYLPNMSACHISILFDLQGPNNTLTTGPSAGLQAVGEAIRILERGAADVMLAGGAESKVNPVGLSQYRILGMLSENHAKDPRTLCRPFDEGSTGIVVGEASSFLVLEEFEHARRRKAPVYAEVLGYGSSSAVGQAQAMNAALNEAQISSKDLNYVQAAGVGFPIEDEKEALAIERVFGGACAKLLVSGSKPLTGFTGFAAGSLDLILSTLALKNQTIPPLMNFEKSKKPLAFQIVKDVPVKKKIEFAMTNAFGLGGQSASVVTRAVAGGV